MKLVNELPKQDYLRSRVALVKVGELFMLDGTTDDCLCMRIYNEDSPYCKTHVRAVSLSTGRVRNIPADLSVIHALGELRYRIRVVGDDPFEEADI